MNITRRNVISLAVAVVVLFVIAIPTSSHHHGFVNVVSNVTWYAGLIGVLLVIVASLIALFQSRRKRLA